jgi:hypothetical protein
MLNRTTYLFVCVIEECAEVIQRACKIIRFGSLEVEPGHKVDNLARFSVEWNDLITVVRLLKERKVDVFEDGFLQEMKREKVKKYMNYSAELEIVEPEEVTK